MADKQISQTEIAESVPLLPCPFCGGEAELATRKGRGGMMQYRYRCSECHAAIGEWHGGVSGRPWTAAEVWNTRAERTYWSICSECDADFYTDQPINYCPNCGARVGV